MTRHTPHLPSGVQAGTYGDAANVPQITVDPFGRVTKAASVAASGGGGVPAGSILFYGASAAPAGWLLCDGSAVSRATYSGLFTAIGTTFGVGDGSTTFNLPDLRGRFPLGTGTGPGLTARALAATGGEEDHTLSVTEMPSHTHTIPYGSGGAPGANQTVGGASTANNTTSSLTGGGGSHNNMPPYLVITGIIKT